jgi:hypothetical protein
MENRSTGLTLVAAPTPGLLPQQPIVVLKVRRVVAESDCDGEFPLQLLTAELP